jgi:hypothetical protein
VDPRISWDLGERRKGALLSAARSAACLVLLAAILALATWLRLERLAEYRYRDLDGDAVAYLQFARGLQLTGPFVTGYIESGLIWLVKGAVAVWGDQPISIRRLTVSASVATVAATYMLGARLFGPATGLLAAGLLAVNRELIFQSVRGLREEAFSVVLLLFVLTLSAGRWPGKPAGWILAGLLGGALGLIRLTGLACAGTLLAARALLSLASRDRPWPGTLWSASLAALLAGTCVLPYLASSLREFGDPFYSLTLHATFYRNFEYAGRPGFPSREELAVDSHAGPPVTPFQYVFRLHGPVEVMKRYIAGARQLYGLWAGSFGTPIAVAGLAGLLGLAGTRWCLLPLALGAAVFPFLFVFGVAPDTSRFAVPTFPLLALASSWALIGSASWAHARLGDRLTRVGLSPPRGSRIAGCAVGLVLVVVVAAYGDQELRSLQYFYDEDFNDLAWRASHEAWRLEGWSLATDGLSLVPGQRGELVYRFDRRRFQRASLRVWFYTPPGVATWLEVSDDGRSFTTVGHNRDYHGEVVDLPDIVTRRKRFYLRLRASYEASEGAEKLVVDKFTLRLHD